MTFIQFKINQMIEKSRWMGQGESNDGEKIKAKEKVNISMHLEIEIEGDLQKGLQKFKYFGHMKNEELEMKILLRQNSELVAKLQWYRRENQELKTKNENLNIWVDNLSQVFATASASWQSITLMEESLLALMRKKTDMKDKTLLRKYIFHFKTFAGIIDNLGHKIMNEGHSDQSSNDAKQQLQSFVKNYEIFFKQFVETYFKFNEESIQLLTEIKSKPEANTTIKAISGQSLEQKLKIKDFESFMESLKDNFKVFQQYNSNTLLSGVVKEKQQQIQKLKQNIYMLERRNKTLFDYNNLSVENQIDNKDIQCFCGGAQLSYMKRQWEQSLKYNGEANQGLKNKASCIENGDGEGMDEGNKVDEQKYQILEEQKQSLINRNQLLLQKIDKMKVQYKLTDQIILKSNIYLILRDQCQYLMDYVSDLLGKIKKNQEYLGVIQKNREEEIRQLRKKIEKNKFGNQSSISLVPLQTQNINFTFKTEAFTLIKDLRSAFKQILQAEAKTSQSQSKFKKEIMQLSKTNDDLHKKLNDYFAREIAKSDNYQFRHEKFKKIQTDVGDLVQKNMPELIQLWKQFIFYVKGRDKKIKDLQSLNRKRQKEIIQKSKILQMNEVSLDQTQKMYKQNKQKLDKMQQFISKMEKDLVSLAEQNFQKKSEFQQEKSLLSLRLKAETDARNKLEEKVALFGRIDEQIKEMRKNEGEIQKNYLQWIQNTKQNLKSAQIQSSEKDITIKSLNDEIAERQKQLSKLQGQKQSSKSQIRQLMSRIDNYKQKSEDEVMRLQLEEYKGKIMCSCSGEREREVVLKTCPHLFCKKCIDDTQNSRNRKCPLCGIRFTKTDIHDIKWN